MEIVTNAHLKQPQPDLPIVATLVRDEDERMKCLPRVAGRHCLVLEFAVYDMLRRMSPDYEGAFWDFFSLSNGGFYMAPTGIEVFRFVCDNGFEDNVAADTAGVIATAMAYSHLSFRNDGDRFGKAYYLLSEFIFQHRDAGMIRAALD